MKRKKLTEADVTAESVFMLKRRQMLKMLGISATALSLPAAAQADLLDWFKGHDRPPAPAGKALEFAKPAEWQANLTLTPEDKVAGYNNFYEFSQRFFFLPLSISTHPFVSIFRASLSIFHKNNFSS